MNTKTLTVVAQVTAKTGKETEVRNGLLSLLAPSRLDPGCLNYDLHEALGKPGSFLFHENWASRAELETHLQQPHVQSVLTNLGGLVSEAPQITLWEKIG
jgi:quinol monooxygenase YgiN